MTKQTKVVATIGPATESKEVISEMVKAGMDVARFNTKHSTPEWHLERIKRVREVAEELETAVGILVDLQGPEVRIELPEEKPFSKKPDETVLFTTDRTKKGEGVIYIPENIIQYFSKDSLVLTDDGACEFIVTEVYEDGFEAKAVCHCDIQHRKTMNTPGTILGLPSITDRDRSYLDTIDPRYIDFIGLSFVRNVEDINILKDELAKRDIKAGIIAKIENQAALDNLDEIIEASDGIMIARGDLGIEVDYRKLTYYQKMITDKCRDAAKPVITATQMLKSMVNNPRPTRAEVSDVANSIYDGTDAVMLSEETTIGKYPVEAVRTQAEIAEFNEIHAQHAIKWPMNISSSLDITSNAANLLKHTQQEIDAVICLTESGRTARLLSRFRPKLPIMTATHEYKICRSLSLSYGIQPRVLDLPEEQIVLSKTVLKKFVKAGLVKPGQTALVIYGSIWKKPGLTNTMSVIKIPSEKEL